MTYDEILKNIIIEKSKAGFAIVSCYDGTVGKGHRKNTKKSEHLEELVLESGLEYKKVLKLNSRKETEVYFILFGSELDPMLEKWAGDAVFHAFTVSYDIENFLKDKKFHHPMNAAEKNAFRARREVFYEDAFEPPCRVRNWHLYRIVNENFFFYEKDSSNIMCAVEKRFDGTWLKSYGGIKPCGFNIRKEIAATREEALKSFSEQKPENPENS